MSRAGLVFSVVFVLASGSQAQPVPDAPVETVSSSQFGGIVRLSSRALAMAQGWSKKAVLYSILGTVPRNNYRLAPETWQFHFGDPVSKDGVLSARQGNRGGIQVSEYFRDGEFESRRTLRENRDNRDYRLCRPITDPFVDGPALDRVVRELKLIGDDKNQFRISLLNARDTRCDGLGLNNLFVFEKSIPKKILSQSLWILTSKNMTLYLDAQSGMPLRKRTRNKPRRPSGAAIATDPETGLPMHPRSSLRR